MVHSRLTSLLTEQELVVVEPHATMSPEVTDELCWWRDLTSLWPNTENISKCTAPTVPWLTSAVARLQGHPDFDWNRSSESGKARVADTVSVLRDALAE
jgi:hypothetical protein